MIKLIGLIILGLPISLVLIAVIASLFKIEDKDTIKSAVIFVYIIYVGVALIIYG